MWHYAGTFDVQDVNISRIDEPSGTIDVTCHFALGSRVKGCVIVIESDTNSTDCEIFATKNEDLNLRAIATFRLPKGTHKLVVLDDKKENPAYISTITIPNSSVTGTGVYVRMTTMYTHNSTGFKLFLQNVRLWLTIKLHLKHHRTMWHVSL